jgi:transposase-like protein
MGINIVQFQKGLSMSDFLHQYAKSEEMCREHLEKSRWPKGFECPDCGSSNYGLVWHKELKTFQCNECHKQTTLYSGTIFEHTKLPLMIWYQAIFFLTQSKNNVSALELTRLLGICYRTAWRMKHKLIQVMHEREQKRKLSGDIQLDDAYLGGECSDGKAGRGSENKIPFLAAIQTNEEGHPLYAVFSQVNSFSKEEISEWAKKRIDYGSDVTSDGLNCFNSIENKAAGRIHTRVVVGSRKSSDLPCFKWVNTILGNLKSAITGTYHAFDFQKYASRYLAEVQYRFNRRYKMAEMFIRLLFACIQTCARPEKWLRLAI